MAEIVLAGILAILVLCYLVVMLERHSEDADIAAVQTAGDVRRAEVSRSSKLEPTGL